MNSTDHAAETAGLPSASGLDRISRCPGSFNLERQSPPEPDTPDEARDAGIAIHNWLSLDALARAAADACPLNDSEFEIFDSCERMARKFCDDFGFDPNVFISEHRAWLLDDEGVAIFSGKWDRIWTSNPGNEVASVAFDRTILLADFKVITWGEHEANVSNLQLRALAVLASKETGAGTVIVKIIQPGRNDDAVEYGPDELARSESEIREIVAAAMEPDAPRYAGPTQCKFCRAKSICKEAHDYANLPAYPGMDKVIVDKDSKDGPVRIVSGMTLPQIKMFWQKSAAIKSILKAVDDHLKGLSDEELKSVGLKRKPGNVVQQISDPLEVWQRISELGVTKSEFLQVLKLPLGDVLDMVKMATGWKGKTLESKMEALLSGCTSERQNKPSIVEVE